ncbi:MAG: hypothetical protein J0I10_10800 [Verrucomicrobia bacterium]|nr:hypothetical protein [Verrucomicrobiota bacterium]
MKKALILAFVAAAILAVAQSPEMNDLSASNALGGKQVLDAIRNATTVTVQRVDTIFPPEDDPNGKSKVVDLGEPFAVPAEQAQALKEAFCSGKTYLSPSKACRFRANVRYGFEGAGDKVTLVLCFGCGEMEVWQKGEMVSFGPFDGGYGHILKLTQSLFPKDEFLAKFDEKIFQERAKRMEVMKP